MHVINFVFFNSKTQKIYIQKRADDRKLFPGRWEFPGGKKEQDETIEQCICRELKEETNYNLKKIIKKLHEYIWPQDSSVLNSIFLIEVDGDFQLEKGKVSEVKWIGIDQVSLLLGPGQKTNGIYEGALKSFGEIRAAHQLSDNQDIENIAKTRILIASPRSGSTLMMRLLSGLSGVRVTSRTILMGNRYGSFAKDEFNPDYRIYDGPGTDAPHPVFKLPQYQEARCLISKEEFGNNLNIGTPDFNECNYPMFRSSNDIFLSKPAFIFREPSSAFNSWLGQGWNRLEAFIITYKALYREYLTAKEVVPDTPCYAYENLINSSEGAAKIIENICNYWGIDFDISCMNFRGEGYKERFLYWDKEEKEVYHKDAHGLFKTLNESGSIIFNHSASQRISSQQQEIINSELSEIYDDVLSRCVSKAIVSGTNLGETPSVQQWAPNNF